MNLTARDLCMNIHIYAKVSHKEYIHWVVKILVFLPL